MELSNEELEQEKQKWKAERAISLDVLNESINTGTVDEMNASFKQFIRMHKQWLLIDDALCAFKLTH